jgi:ribosomal protein L34
MKRKYQPSKTKRVRKCGFRKRMRKNYSVIIRRRHKGRYRITVV